jgi:DNA-directed RNA polymerase subunit RPC12/RpoP
MQKHEVHSTGYLTNKVRVFIHCKEKDRYFAIDMPPIDTYYDVIRCPWCGAKITVRVYMRPVAEIHYESKD